MIYFFTTFILTLLLSHIAHAMPTSGDATSPEELYDPTYADAQHALPIADYLVLWSSRYDNKNGDTMGVSCSTGPHGLARRYPHFGDFPSFPYIGGAFNVEWGTEYCGTCWNLTNLRTHKTISVTVIDNARPGYNISEEAFVELNGGGVGNGRLAAEAKQVSPHFCGFR